MRHLELAARALSAHRFRSALTVSSITLGAFSIVLMSSLASSGLATLVRDIEQLGGARIILVAPRDGEGDRPPGELTREDRAALFAAVPHLAQRTVYAALGEKEVVDAAGVAARTDVVAADAGFFEALHLEVARGRAFGEDDDRRHARVCVVADGVARERFDGEAVGRWITVDGERCKIIGQLAPIHHWDTNFGFEWLRFVAMPLESAAETRPEVRRASLIQLVTDGVEHNDVVKRVAAAILDDRHHGARDFEIWDFNAFMAQFHTMFAVMEAVVGLLAGVALLVGGIGVMNMMLVSVSERTREIGVQMAIGAGPRTIVRQFLWEASLLSSSGGLLGAALGVAVAVAANAGIRRLEPSWVAQVSWPSVAVALSACLLIGVGFGVVPARQASRLDPVEAMRR